MTHKKQVKIEMSLLLTQDSSSGARERWKEIASQADWGRAWELQQQKEPNTVPVNPEINCFSGLILTAGCGTSFLFHSNTDSWLMVPGGQWLQQTRSRALDLGRGPRHHPKEVQGW